MLEYTWLQKDKIMKQSNKHTKSISFWMKEADYKKMRKIIEERGIKISDYLRDLVMDDIDKNIPATE